MNGSAIPIFLQDQYARTLWIIRIIFHNYGFCDSLDNISDKNLVCGQFVISVIGNPYLTALEQIQNMVKCLAHRDMLACESKYCISINAMRFIMP